MILIVNRYLVPTGYRGIAIYPFVLARDRSDVNDPVFINHEKIHLRQQAELLIVFFYIWYLTEYLIGLLRFRDHQKAYQSIIFEREAYKNEKDLSYLEKRSFWRFLKT